MAAYTGFKYYWLQILYELIATVLYFQETTYSGDFFNALQA